MSNPSTQSQEEKPRDAAHWAKPVSTLEVEDVPVGATSLNVEGRQVVGPLQGFGQLWQKTYRLRLGGIDATPEEVIQVWKENLPRFQPKQNRFYPSVAGVAPGEVVLINASTPGGPVSTGVMVLYADDESFTLMTPEGHPESGWVTFSAYEENGATVAQVQSMARTNDPIYEIAFRFVGSELQESIWTHVLESLGAHYGVGEEVQFHKTCVDPSIQWSQAKNVWHNAQIRTMLYTVAAPVRWVRGLVE